MVDSNFSMHSRSLLHLHKVEWLSARFLQTTCLTQCSKGQFVQAQINFNWRKGKGIRQNRPSSKRRANLQFISFFACLIFASCFQSDGHFCQNKCSFSHGRYVPLNHCHYDWWRRDFLSLKGPVSSNALTGKHMLLLKRTPVETPVGDANKTFTGSRKMVIR